MGANKRWKRKARRIDGECQRVFGMCCDCLRKKECDGLPGILVLRFCSTGNYMRDFEQAIKKCNIEKAHPKKISKYCNNNL